MHHSKPEVLDMVKLLSGIGAAIRLLTSSLVYITCKLYDASVLMPNLLVYRPILMSEFAKYCNHNLFPVLFDVLKQSR